MKKFWFAFLVYWIAVALIYFMSAFDGAYSERLYSAYEFSSLPMSAITGNYGIALEGKYGLTAPIFISRILLDLMLPALVDFGLISGASLLWRKVRQKESASSTVASEK